jgi:hypothetical protein
MHLHLPKPLHGWREFVGEVGIIVLGVLIALGAEQLIENRHWHHQVELGREALREEVRDNLNAVQSRMVLEPCVRSRLDQLGALLRELRPGQPIRLAGKVGIPIPNGGAKGAWNIALSSQAAAHMPLREQLEYSNAFDNYENWDRIRAEERAAWVKLSLLDAAPRLSEAELAGLRQAYAEAVAADTRVANVGAFIFRTANVGQKPDEFASADELFKQAGYGSELCRTLAAQ